MSLRKSLFWSLGQQFGVMALQLANMMIIARVLTPAEIGMFVVALSIVTMLQALREMGVTNYLIRDRHLTDDTIRAAFGMSIALCSLLMVILLMLRSPLETWMDTPGLAAVLGPILLVIAIFPIEQPAMALIRRDMRFDVLARLSILAKFLGVVTSISLALMGFSTMALVWGLLMESVVRTALLARAENRHLRVGPSLRGWRPLLSFGAWVSGASLAGQAAAELPKILLGALLGPGPTAIFDRAVRIPGLVRMGIFMPLSRVLLSSFSEDLRQGNDLGPKVIRLTTITSGMVWPTFAVMSLLAEEIILLMLGPQWGLSAKILPWLLLSQAVLALLPQPDQILVPYGSVRRLFLIRLSQLCLTLGIAYLALTTPVADVHPLEVYAWTTTFITLLFVGIIWFAVRRFIGRSIRGILHGHLKSASVTAVTALPVWLWQTEMLGEDNLIRLALALLAAVILGVGTGFALRHPLAGELMRGLIWLKKRSAAGA